MSEGTLLDEEVDTRDTLGIRVQQFRELRGMSIRGLASEAKVSSSFISQLENGHTNASVASLRKLAAALGVSPAELLDSRSGHTRGVLRAANRPKFPLDGAEKYVVSMPPMRNLEVYAGRLEPGGNTGEGQYVHGNAQEIIVVTLGSVKVELGEETYHLDKGDSIEFLSSVPHRVENVSKLPAEVMWINSPPTPEATQA